MVENFSNGQFAAEMAKGINATDNTKMKWVIVAVSILVIGVGIYCFLQVSKMKIANKSLMAENERLRRV